MKSPLNLVKESFGDKAKLVEAVQAFTNDDLWVSRENKDKGLAHVSNAKLLRLHTIFSAVKEKFGTRAKLIDAIMDLEKRVKDDGYKSRLLKFPVPRLYDLYRALVKRTTPKPPVKKVARPAGVAPVKKVAPKKKAVAKKSPAATKKTLGKAAKAAKIGNKGKGR